MKRKIILLIAAIIVMGLTLVAFGLNSGGISLSTTASCCHGDSCPMKKTDPSGKETKSCCDNCSCCKGENGAESCPMKNKGAGDANSQTEHKSCGCPCCKKDHDKESHT